MLDLTVKKLDAIINDRCGPSLDGSSHNWCSVKPDLPMQNSQIPITIAVPDNSISASPNEPRPRSSNLLVAYLFVTAILSIFAVVLPFFVFPAFGEVFRAFGADLPDLTRFLMASGPYWGLAPFLSAIVAFDVWRRKECASRYRTIVSGLLAGFIIVAMAILPICVWGMYLPIFRLASVV